MFEKLRIINLNHHMCLIIFCLLPLGCLTPVFGQSASYQVQAHDRLSISFWDRPELNTEVTVDDGGEIELPVIGRLAVAGLSISQLKQEIISQMALYNTVITQLGIEVIDFGSKQVHVTGQVRLPGMYSFEEITNVWEVILRAGGPLQTAFLDEVVLVRKSENGKLYVINVSAALRDGKVDELPKVYPGDTIHLDGAGETGAAQSPLLVRNEVYVLGEVLTPGSVRFSEGTDILEAIALAGGYTQTAKLNKVRHISVSTGTVSVTEIDLEKYTKESVPTPILVGPGDSIVVPRRSTLGDRLLITGLTALITASITTAVVLGTR